MATAPKPQPFVRQGEKVGRNDPCPCGSGKKYKHCHGRLELSRLPTTDRTRLAARLSAHYTAGARSTVAVNLRAPSR